MIIKKSPEEITENYWNNMAVYVDESIPLEKLSGLISALMKLGLIEVACMPNEKSRYVYFESTQME